MALRALRLVEAFGGGAVVNPGNLADQVEGGVLMGLGGALLEAVDVAGGRRLNVSLSGYRVPGLPDFPEFGVGLLDRPDQPPGGGAGAPVVAVAAAIATAVAGVCGVRRGSMPLAPDSRIPALR